MPDSRGIGFTTNSVRAVGARKIARAKSKKIEAEIKQCYDNLNSFIKNNIDRIKKETDFSTFCLLLEAVYAYHYDLSITHGIRD